MIEVIMLDMDGVLCDFSQKYNELFGMYPDKTPKKKWKANWEEFVLGEHFKTLEWHEHGRELYEGVKKHALYNGIKIEILTSAAGDAMIDSIAYQKRKWLLNNNIKHRYAHIVPGKKYKKDFADPKHLLIDDMDVNVAQFRVAGGNAILHKTAKDTLEQLTSGNYASL